MVKFIFIFIVLASSLSSSETTIKVTATLKKVGSVFCVLNQDLLQIPPYEDIPKKGLYFSEVATVFISYNGSQPIEVDVQPVHATSSKLSNQNFKFFHTKAQNKANFSYTLRNELQKTSYSKSASIFTTSQKETAPLFQKKIPLGIHIEKKSLDNLSAGTYTSTLSIKLKEKG